MDRREQLSLPKIQRRLHPSPSGEARWQVLCWEPEKEGRGQVQGEGGFLDNEMGTMRGYCPGSLLLGIPEKLSLQ
jgi:hypothetical protein